MGTLLFPAIFLILFVLILWVIIGCKGWWFAKFWLINISVFLVLVLWSSLPSYLGWPSDDALPDTFRFLSFFPEEPKKLYVLIDKHEDDVVEAPLSDIFKYKSPSTIRLYELPYDKELHEKLEAAAERAMKGAYVVGSRNNILNAEQLRDLQKSPSPGSGIDGGNLSRYLGGLEFYVLPPSLFIKKPNS